MKRYRFLVSPRWLGWFALVLVLAAACGALGKWQLDRRDRVVATIERIESNFERSPADYAAGANDFATFTPDREWTPVRFTGVYETADQLIVRNRPFNGQPGYEVLTPLRLDDGTAVIIDRGWLPIGNDRAGRPDTVPAPPSGRVEVVARVRPAEPAVDRGAPEGQTASIDLNGYAARLDYPLQTGAYGQLDQETPAPAQSPLAFPKPSIDEGPHLSYSLQWFAFGVLLFVGFGYAARQQAVVDAEESEAAEGPASGTPPEGPQRTRAPRQRRPTAEEEEDALLDAQGLQ